MLAVIHAAFAGPDGVGDVARCSEFPSQALVPTSTITASANRARDCIRGLRRLSRAIALPSVEAMVGGDWRQGVSARQNAEA